MRKMLVLLVPLFILALVVCGCGDTCTICGLYVNQYDPESHIEINSDFTCIGPVMEGSWEVCGSELKITTPLGLIMLEIQGNKLIDEYGSVWVKRGT